MFKRTIALVTYVVAILTCPSVGQEPATPHFRYRIKEVTNDHLVLILPLDAFSQEPEHLVTYRVGSPLPESDWIITSLKVWTVKENGINRAVQEIGLRDSPTGREFTFSPQKEGLTRRSGD